MLIRNKVILGTALFLFTSAASLLNADQYHARIVRISHAKGTVRLNNQDVTINMPLIEGNVLTTGLESLAEIEFEDGSTLRMGPETQISLSQLARLASGDPVTEIDLGEGEVELSITGRNGGEFSIQARSKTVRFPSRGQFRVLSTHSDPLELAVWNGEAIVHDKESGQDAAVEKDEVFTLAADDPRLYVIENGIEADGLDQWSQLRDQELAQESASIANLSASPSPPVFSSVDFVDPCERYYWYPNWYPGLFPDCFSPSFGYAPLAFVPFYPPVFYHHHHHHPHIHPPTPPVTAAFVRKTGTFYPRSVEPVRHAVRIFNDETFKRSVPISEQRETKVISKEASKETSGSREGASSRTIEARGSHPSEGARSTDSHHSTSQGSHSNSSYSPHSSSSSSSGSRSYSGGGSHSGGSSHSSFSSGSSGSSSSGASSHSSSSSASSSGSSGRSK